MQVLPDVNARLAIDGKKPIAKREQLIAFH
jgi:hypothetical protein